MMARSPQLARLEARLNAIPKRVRDAVQPSLDKSAAELVTLQKQLVPVDDGDLKGSIRAEAGDHELQRKIFTDDFKARWIEFGVPHRPASPFFFTSWRLLRKRIQSRVKRAISKSVKENWGRS
jgi:hypothetical protein